MISEHAGIVGHPGSGRTDSRGLDHAPGSDLVSTALCRRPVKSRSGNCTDRRIATHNSIYGPDHTMVCGIDYRGRELLRLSQSERRALRMYGHTHGGKRAGIKTELNEHKEKCKYTDCFHRD